MDGVVYLVWAVVELPVELARVEVGEEGLELAGRLHLGVVGKQVHVSEAGRWKMGALYCNQGGLP